MFNDTGELSLSGTYTKGLKEGEWVWYDGQGNIHKKEVFKESKLIQCEGNCD